MKTFSSPFMAKSPLANKKREQRLKEKIKETGKKAFIRSNSTSEEYEETRGEKRAQKKYNRLQNRLDRVQKRNSAFKVEGDVEKESKRIQENKNKGSITRGIAGEEVVIKADPKKRTRAEHRKRKTARKLANSDDSVQKARLEKRKARLERKVERQKNKEKKKFVKKKSKQQRHNKNL